MENALNAAIPLLGIPPEKVANPQLIDWWPNPGKMPNYGIKKGALPANRQIMQYLNSWYYRDMSSHSHLSFYAIMKTGFLALADLYDSETRERIREGPFPWFRSQQVIRTVTLLLALMSETEKYFDFGLAPELLVLWDELNKVQPEAKEIFDRRYKTFWPNFLLS